MISFQKIYGLYGLEVLVEHHTVEIDDEQTISEDSATQSTFDTVRLSFAKYVCLMCLLAVNFVYGLNLSYLDAIL